jgi:hypothetical protein
VETWGDGILRVLTLLLVILLLVTTANAAKRPIHRFPHWWYLQAVCIHRHEAVDWRSNTGNGYYGGFQFLLNTWHRAGGHGYPHQARPNEQYYRSWIIWKMNGGSWREWGTAGMCGLR